MLIDMLQIVLPALFGLIAFLALVLAAVTLIG
jgi:hypothetical protein